MVSQLQLAAEGLPLPEDRLLTFVEGAQVCVQAGGPSTQVTVLWLTLSNPKPLNP